VARNTYPAVSALGRASTLVSDAGGGHPIRLAVQARASAQHIQSTADCNNLPLAIRAESSWAAEIAPLRGLAWTS